MHSNIKDETGNKYGRLIVLEYAGTNKHRHAQWLCRCECGNETIVPGISLRSGSTKSCGCLATEKAHERGKARLINEVGSTYGRLTIIKRFEDYVAPCGHHSIQWLCKCECGNEIVVLGNNLRNGNTKSCGCLQKEALSETHLIDETGNKYGRLTVLKRSENGANGQTRWLCECECGNKTTVRGSRLRAENTKSCGCLATELASERAKTYNGEKHPNWKGGISFEPYDINFTEEFKEKVRKRDLYYCQLCGKTQEENGRSLDIHHIDYDKENSVQENCISLCVSCHMKTNYNREFWRDKLIEFMGEKYG